MAKAVIRSGIGRGFTISVPSSKVLSHRALIAASLAEGTSVLYGTAEGRDIETTMNAMEKLGARFEKTGNILKVYGTGGKISYDGSVIDCGESGSTLRFLIPILALTGTRAVFLGHGRLMERPLDIYRDLFEKQGLLFKANGDTLQIQGTLKPGCLRVPGSISSQFISGLMFALPLLNEDSTITVLPPFESSSYVFLTKDVLADAGIFTEISGGKIFIPGSQSYRRFEYTVPGDDSQAAFFMVLSMISGMPADIRNMDHGSAQPDHKAVDIIRQFGGTVNETDDGYRVIPGPLKGADTDLADCPDLGPALFALASVAEGRSVFRNASRLRLKECDRISAMETELAKLGCGICSDRDNVYIEGSSVLKDGIILDPHNDHRIAMSLAVLAAGAGKKAVITDAEAVEKSYPAFFRDLALCGAGLEYNR